MIYEAVCKICARKDTYVRSVAKMDDTPECCGKPMRRILSLPMITREPDYVTADITGSPVRITSRKQRDKLCRENNVTPLLKNKWQ